MSHKITGPSNYYIRKLIRNLWKTKMASFITAFPNTKIHRIKIVVNPNKQHEETTRTDNTWSSFIQAPKPKISFNNLFEIFELQFFKRFIKLFA